MSKEGQVKLRSNVRSRENGPRAVLGSSMVADFRCFLAPADGQRGVILPAREFFITTLQRVALDIAHARLDDTLRLGIVPLASDGFQVVVTTQREKFRMQAGLPPDSIHDCGAQIIEDDLPRTAAKKFQRVNQGPVKLRLAPERQNSK